MNDAYYSLGLIALTSYFTLVNPLGVMPVFMTMTAELSPLERRKTAMKATLVAMGTILFFMFSGNVLFDFFGISINALRIVGGIIFFMMGQDMLQAKLGKIKVKESEIKQYVDDISVTPLAIPMICGPGTITNSIVLMQDADTPMKKLVLIGSAALVMAATFGILYTGSRLIKIIGQTGLNVMMRLMGLIVMVIAVEFFFSGLRPILAEVLAG
ncbi:MAG: MarC family protein [Bacteroidota bacterium]